MSLKFDGLQVFLTFLKNTNAKTKKARDDKNTRKRTD